MEFDTEKPKDAVKSDQAQELAIMTRSSIVGSEEIEEWKTTQEEDLVV